MKYVFLHIPKNGGTTLQSIVDSQYYNFQIYNIPDQIREEALAKLKAQSNFSKRLIKVVKGGHFKYGCHEYFKNPGQVKYFAMLRNPVERAVSYYWYVKRTPEHYLHNTFITEKITLEDFVDRPDLNMEITNGQTKLIGGFEQEDKCTVAAFDMCMDNLEKSFFLVGIMESYIETLYLLKKELSWTKQIQYEILNINKDKKNQISDGLIKKINEINQFDIHIYNKYDSIFNEKVRSFSKDDFEDFKVGLK